MEVLSVGFLPLSIAQNVNFSFDLKAESRQQNPC